MEMAPYQPSENASTGSWTSANNESQTALKTRERDEAPSKVSRISFLNDIQKDINDIQKDSGEKDITDINLDNLMEDISNLLKQIEEEKAPQYPEKRDWLSPLQNLKDILSPETSSDKLREIISNEIKSKEIISKEKSSKSSELPIVFTSLKKKLKNTAQKWEERFEKILSKEHSGEIFVSARKVITSGPVREVLKGLGHASLATTALLVVAHSLEMYAQVCSNKRKCFKLLKEMCYVGSLVKDFKEISPKGFHNVIQDATSLIVEGAITCSTQIGSSPWVQFFSESNSKTELSEITEKLDSMYMKMNVQISLRVLTATETEKSPLWKRHPKHAVGIQDAIADVLNILECKSDQNAVTVILHGSRGIGKTTLADAVFSKVDQDYQYSKVRLLKDIDSTGDIIEFQKKILKDLMGPEDTLPDIRTVEDGRDALEDMLEKVEAFIYIDNVLKSSELQRLLPKDLAKAKKVRFLVTARDITDLKYACPTTPKFYHMKGIQSPEAMSILKKETREGINDNQFNEIIKICGGSPLRLTLVAPFIGCANDKQKAYETLMQLKGNWDDERFDKLRCLFAHNEIEHMEDVIHDHRTPIKFSDQVPTPPPTQKRLREHSKRCNTPECNETQDEPSPKKMRMRY